MIFKNEDFKIDEYTYHKWRALPGEFIAYFLARDFSETDRFQAALYYESTLPCTHTITGVVEAFYLQAGNSKEAVLSVSVNLVDNTRRNNGNNILMQKKYRRGIATPTGGPQGLAESLSIAMQQISSEILDDVSKEIGNR
jgi:cholesterol transport system auxiliary component